MRRPAPNTMPGRKQERLPRPVTHFYQANGTKQTLLLKDRTIRFLSTLAKVHQLGILVRVAGHAITSLASVPARLVSLVQLVKGFPLLRKELFHCQDRT